MMPLSLQGGFVVYIMAWLLTLTVLWTREIWRTKKYDWTLSENKLCVCDSCHLAFLVKPSVNITRCPRCNDMCIIRARQRRF